MPNYEVLPAVIAKTQAELDSMLSRVPFAENIMLDLMDGRFVGSVSLDFKMNLPEGHRYQLHVMANDPLERIHGLPGVIDTVILHAEALQNIGEAVKHVETLGLEPFIALNPETSVKIVEPHLDSLDGVLVMTVNPGQYGAKFLPEQLSKVRVLRDLSPTINIEVDGGMNDQTADLAIKAGANMIASGSYIMKNIDPKTAYKRLKHLVCGS